MPQSLNSIGPKQRNGLTTPEGLFNSAASRSMSTLQHTASCQASGKSVIKLKIKKPMLAWNWPPIKSTTQNAHKTSALWRNRANKMWKRLRGRTFRSNGLPRSPFSCKHLIVVSCVLQVSVCWASGDGWVRLRKLSLLCLISPTPRRHYRHPRRHRWGWWLTSALNRTSQLIQGRILHTVTYFSTSFVSVSCVFHHFI